MSWGNLTFGEKCHRADMNNCIFKIAIVPSVFIVAVTYVIYWDVKYEFAMILSLFAACLCNQYLTEEEKTCKN